MLNDTNIINCGPSELSNGFAVICNVNVVYGDAAAASRELSRALGLSSRRNVNFVLTLTDGSYQAIPYVSAATAGQEVWIPRDPIDGEQDDDKTLGLALGIPLGFFAVILVLAKIMVKSEEKYKVKQKSEGSGATEV